MVVHISDTPRIVVISSYDEPIKDPKDDSKFEEHHIDHKVEDAESSAFNSSFDSVEEPEDESDPNYNPSRDRSFSLGDDFLFDRSVVFCTAQSVG